MELVFKFFDKEEWSMYGTINVLIPFILLLAFRQKLTISVLIIASLLGMMKGDLLSRILFTGFLNFLVYEKNKDWVIRSIIFVVSTIIMNYIPYGHKFHRMVMESSILLNVFRITIALWMIYIFYLMA